jgi:hypothetical protein
MVLAYRRRGWRLIDYWWWRLIDHWGRLIDDLRARLNYHGPMLILPNYMA